MKRLTINQIARANLRHNRRAYLSMAIGIFMAVFLAASLCLSVQGVMARRAEDRAEAYGRMDVFTVNDNRMSDAELLETGYFEPDIGHVYVTAQSPNTTVATGFYDETAVPMMNRKLLEGRMPEAPGEVALEQSALDRLRMEAAVGDTITLTLMPYDGLPEERSYTIVGLLKEQSVNLNSDLASSQFDGEIWPAILTCADEPGFSTGNVVTHRLLTLRPFVSRYQVMSLFDWGGLYNQTLYTVADDYTGPSVTSGNYLLEPVFMLQRLLENVVLPIICVLGAALLIAVCAGISGAMESQLARKTEEIGMLRAVGATKRQIRRIFGRESWLVALTVSPAALGLALLFVWLLSRMAPAYLMFRPSLWVLLPMLALVTVVIFVSSSLPLRRASRTMPMSVLRDTAILRKARRIKPRKRFKVPALVARRQLTLHPTRLIGSVLLVAMMLVVACLGAMVSGVDVTAYMANSSAFTINHTSSVVRLFDFAFTDTIPTQALLASDLEQLASLPLVQSVRPHRELRVCFETDAVSDYYLYTDFTSQFNRHLASEEGLAMYAAEEEHHAKRMAEYGMEYIPSQSDKRIQAEHRAVQSVLGTTRPLATLPIVVLRGDLSELAPYVTEGKLDMDAVNAGREVLVYAPDYYIYETDSDIYYNLIAPSSWYLGDNYLRRYENDVLTVGQVLPIAQFYETDDARMHQTILSEDAYEAQYKAFYEAANLRRATVTVGALLGDLHSLRDYPFEACLITTDEGLRSMGLNYDKVDNIEIYLSGTPDEETEQWLESRIASIASRGGMVVTNMLAEAREDKAMANSALIAILCIAVVFFAAAAGLICGNVSRQIRADSRMIGTLRAVGADDRALVGCYSRSIFISIGLGTILAGVIIGVMMATGFIATIDQANYTASLICTVILIALMLGCCLGVLRLRVKDVIKKSIVENIKEL